MAEGGSLHPSALVVLEIVRGLSVRRVVFSVCKMGLAAGPIGVSQPDPAFQSILTVI